VGSGDLAQGYPQASWMSSRLAIVIAVVALTAGALWYLTAPPKGEDGYREEAASSAETLRSQVELARIWVEATEDEKSTKTAALVGLQETERDAVGAASSFEGYEPPAGLNPLRSELSSLANETSDALGSLRISAEQEEWERLSELASPLSDLAARLEEFEERVEP
jgi:hypothetical protein